MKGTKAKKKKRLRVEINGAVSTKGEQSTRLEVNM